MIDRLLVAVLACVSTQQLVHATLASPDWLLEEGQAEVAAGHHQHLVILEFGGAAGYFGAEPFVFLSCVWIVYPYTLIK